MILSKFFHLRILILDLFYLHIFSIFRIKAPYYSSFGKFHYFRNIFQFFYRQYLSAIQIPGKAALHMFSFRKHNIVTVNLPDDFAGLLIIPLFLMFPSHKLSKINEADNC